MITVLRISPEDSARLGYKVPAPNLEDSLGLLRRFIESVLDPQGTKLKDSMFQVNKTAKTLQMYGNQPQILALLTECLKTCITKHLVIGKSNFDLEKPSSESSEGLRTPKIIKDLADFYSNLTRKIIPTISSVLGFTASALDTLVTHLLTTILASAGIASGFEIMNCFNYLKNAQAVEYSCKVNSQTMNVLKHSITKPIDKSDIKSPVSVASSQKSSKKGASKLSKIIQDLKSGPGVTQNKPSSPAQAQLQPGSTPLSQRKAILSSLNSTKSPHPKPQMPSLNVEALPGDRALAASPAGKSQIVEESGSRPVPSQARTLDWICGALIAAVDTDRFNMSAVQLEDISTVCRLLRRTNCFDGEFKKTFLEQTSEFYRELLQRRLPINNLHEYTTWLEDKMQEERARCDTLFDDSLSQSVHYVMKKILVDDIISSILNANFQNLLLEGHRKELAFYHELMKSSEIFDNFLVYFEGVVRTQVEAALSSREDSIDSVYRFYHTMAGIVKSVYKEETRVQNALDRSLEAVISKSDATFARQLGLWLAQKLESEQSDRRVDEVVLQAITLLRFVQNKKNLMNIYNQKLLTRLGKISAIPVAKETAILERLQTEYGQAFVENGFDIIEQFNKCRKSSLEFITSVHQPTSLGSIELEMLVVPMSSWPFPTNKSNDILVEPFVTIGDHYKTFYNRKLDGGLTTINFQPDVSSCSVAFHYSQGKSILLECLNMYQAATLLLVSERSSVTVSTCMRYLDLKKAEFEAELEELFHFSPPILTRPNADMLSEHDKLVANPSFTYDKSFFKFNQAKQREVTLNSIESDEKLFQERKSVLESVTVRILKEHKKKTHQELLELVSKRLPLEVTDRDFRKTIQSLMKSDFVKRDETNPNLYHYIP